MIYQIEIVETLSIVKAVEATSKDDALKYVRALYKAEEIILTADNANVDTKIQCIGKGEL